MSSVRLSSTSYLVLGLIGLRGPSTPYELKRAVERSGIGEFWPFPHTQLYDEPARLADAGLLEEEREAVGRRRRLIRARGIKVIGATVIPRGRPAPQTGWSTANEKERLALNEWIRRPEGGGFQVRDIASLKLFFSELGADTADIVALAQLQQAFHRDRLARYEALDARYADRPERARRLAPLQFGLHLTRAAIEFWGSVIDHPPGSQDVSTRSPSDGASSDEREPEQARPAARLPCGGSAQGIQRRWSDTPGPFTAAEDR